MVLSKSRRVVLDMMAYFMDVLLWVNRILYVRDTCFLCVSYLTYSVLYFGSYPNYFVRATHLWCRNRIFCLKGIENREGGMNPSVCLLNIPGSFAIPYENLEKLLLYSRFPQAYRCGRKFDP